jgi:hypothetical protein
MTVAKASIILKAAGKYDYEHMDDRPSSERLEVARQLMLARGYQLEHDEGELGAPDHYSPSPELKGYVRRMLEAENYDLRDEVRQCTPAPLHGPMGESIG